MDTTLDVETEIYIMRSIQGDIIHNTEWPLTIHFTLRRYASAVYDVTNGLSVRPSGRLSVPSRSSTKTANRGITQTRRHDRLRLYAVVQKDTKLIAVTQRNLNWLLKFFHY